MQPATLPDSSAQLLRAPSPHPHPSTSDRVVDADSAARVDALRREGRELGRFILGRAVEPVFVDRYVEAHRHVPLAGSDDDAATVRFAVAHPWLLPSMEAAAALRRPHGLLHRKAILMLAILEASPSYADDFLPRRTTWIGLVALGARAAVGSALRVAIGLPLLVVTGRRR